MLGGVKHPLNNADFSSFLLQAQSSKAKIIGLANAGGDTTNSIKQAAEFGIVSGGQKLAGMLMFITDVHALGLKVAQGLNFTETFYWDVNDQTRAFTKRFNEKYKKSPPTMVQAGVYSSLIHYFKALEALGGNPHDGRAVVAKMKEMPTDDRPVRQGLGPRRRPQDPSGLSVRGEEAGGFEISVGLLQPRRHHPGRGSLHPARQERLPVAEEDLIRRIVQSAKMPASDRRHFCWAIGSPFPRDGANRSVARRSDLIFKQPALSSSRRTPVPILRGGVSTSLRAQRSNPFFLRAERWIASLRSQ